MARAKSASAGPKTPAKAKKTRATRGKTSFVDDEAAESDEGVLVDSPKDEEEYDMMTNEYYHLYFQQFCHLQLVFRRWTMYERKFKYWYSARCSGGKEYYAEAFRGQIIYFIVGVRSMVFVHYSPRKRLGTSAVIDIKDSSDEEDMEAMDIDDSMFRKPAGVKSSALPSPLLTRSTAKKVAPLTETDPSIDVLHSVVKKNRSPVIEGGDARLEPDWQ
ncbi:hypothetical protein C8F04DRAFT_1270229 [Mycena alexandri]|uniref:Uncharacterized protein n=1 Tax=Mycena alexandri TaxID=1745969 RepID=A0AAD6SEF0_9AGAR|nr:hypothetical protein C8F04DRAFT_1270229 [Mycena alexandri]